MRNAAITNQVEITKLDDLLPTTKREVCGFAKQLASELTDNNIRELCNAYITWAGKRGIHSGLFIFINPKTGVVNFNNKKIEKYHLIMLGTLCVDLNECGEIVPTYKRILELENTNNGHLDLDGNSYWCDSNGLRVSPFIETNNMYNKEETTYFHPVYTKEEAEDLLKLLQDNAPHLGLNDAGEFTFFVKLKSLLELHNYYSGVLTLESDNIVIDNDNSTKRLCILMLDDYCIVKLNGQLQLRQFKPFLKDVMSRNKGVTVNSKHSIIPNPARTGSLIPNDEYIKCQFLNPQSV
ncbi:MAG: hypothetical protein BEN18_11130 [Epulopiscium sp. Nuni2H_MBin001]|nr:MAG: hypothetical protein BEN18_11130 [Epulopiscium sp. Nuni2H_MBin001]